MTPWTCSPAGSSVQGILQARMLEWVAVSSAKGSSQPKDQTWVSHIAGRFFIIWTIREVLLYCSSSLFMRICSKIPSRCLKPQLYLTLHIYIYKFFFLYEWAGSIYRVYILGKRTIRIPGRMGSSHYSEQPGDMHFKTYELFISGIFHLLRCASCD